MSGYTPVIKSVNDNQIYKDFLESADGGDNIAALSTKVCVEQESMYLTSPAFDGSADARDEVGKLLDRILVLPMDADLEVAIKAEFDKAIRNLSE